MPWQCKCPSEQPDTVQQCAVCGGDKTTWTLQHDVTRQFVLTASKLQILRAKPDRDGKLILRVEVDPNDPLSADDRFILLSKHGDFTPQVRSVTDDQAAGDAVTDLAFADLDRALAYSLRIDPGAEGEPYFLFEEVPFQDLAGESSGEAPAGARARRPDEVKWKKAKAVRVFDKGSLRDLAQRGVEPDPERLLLVRLNGADYEGEPVELTIVYGASEARSLGFTAPAPREGASSCDLKFLFAFGPGSLEGVEFPGIELVDLSEAGERGYAPAIEVTALKRKPKSLDVEGPQGGRLCVRIQVDPNDPLSADETFYLSSSGAFPTQVKTVRDDVTPGDDSTDLVFVGLDESLNYTLTVDPGAEGEPYEVFSDQPFAQLSGC